MPDFRAAQAERHEEAETEGELHAAGDEHRPVAFESRRGEQDDGEGGEGVAERRGQRQQKEQTSDDNDRAAGALKRGGIFGIEQARLEQFLQTAERPARSVRIQ